MTATAPTARALKLAAKRADAAISAAYLATCAGVGVNILNIPRIFAEGRRALAEGRDLETAIRTLVGGLK